ncbi:hypothetical protein [Propionimicrobium sp. PCR01-08-3]|uniref:hypothetical protein n=1 Tax=Propionimicrobium sp. PCR01-08-3 TaxID=3052086 RepID=UPI00255CE517|nr:hypothetical protein [Propionimicrobium sp. PCR01-08-3]WIY82231.1 hypothetical protein QQ658_12105 [Propionimicrobium sp. PCR01-08-3]
MGSPCLDRSGTDRQYALPRILDVAHWLMGKLVIVVQFGVNSQAEKSWSIQKSHSQNFFSC